MSVLGHGSHVDSKALSISLSLSFAAPLHASPPMLEPELTPNDTPNCVRVQSALNLKVDINARNAQQQTVVWAWVETSPSSSSPVLLVFVCLFASFDAFFCILGSEVCFCVLANI